MQWSGCGVPVTCTLGVGVTAGSTPATPTTALLVSARYTFIKPNSKLSRWFNL